MEVQEKMHIQNSIDEYLNYCKAIKRLDELTIKAYRIDLNQFLNYLNNAGTREDLAAIIESYIALSHSRFKPKTVKRKIASVKAFFNYMYQKRITDSNPFDKISTKFKEPSTVPKTIPLSNVEAILTAAYNEKITGSTARKRENAVRDVALIEMLFATGIRISELCSLTPQSVDLSNHIIKILGKGSKERLIQIENRATLNSLVSYYNRYEASIRKCNRFFTNSNGTPLSDQSARRIIRKYAGLASVDQHITPHMFRHTFATSLLDADVDIRYIQELLGHSSISTTQIYTHVSLSKQRSILATKHPRNNFAIMDAK